MAGVQARVKRASSVCLEPGCTNPIVRRGRCSEHALPAWSDSEERARAFGVPERGTRGPLRRLRDQVRRRARNRCERCGRSPQVGERFVVDHITPRAEGGESNEANLWLLCPGCDLAKTTLDLARMRAAQL